MHIVVHWNGGTRMHRCASYYQIPIKSVLSHIHTARHTPANFFVKRLGVQVCR